MWILIAIRCQKRGCRLFSTQLKSTSTLTDHLLLLRTSLRVEEMICYLCICKKSNCFIAPHMVHRPSPKCTVAQNLLTGVTALAQLTTHMWRESIGHKPRVLTSLLTTAVPIWKVLRRDVLLKERHTDHIHIMSCLQLISCHLVVLGLYL